MFSTHLRTTVLLSSWLDNLHFHVRSVPRIREPTYFIVSNVATQLNQLLPDSRVPNVCQFHHTGLYLITQWTFLMASANSTIAAYLLIGPPFQHTSKQPYHLLHQYYIMYVMNNQLNYDNLLYNNCLIISIRNLDTAFYIWLFCLKVRSLFIEPSFSIPIKNLCSMDLLVGCINF